MEKVIEILEAAGWVADGRTQSDTVRVSTQAAPVYGGVGGEIRAFGGRLRFAKGEQRCTVGKRTTCFYHVVNKIPADFINVKTKEIDKVKELVNKS
jgi:hypothetical protein